MLCAALTTTYSSMTSNCCVITARTVLTFDMAMLWRASWRKSRFCPRTRHSLNFFPARDPSFQSSAGENIGMNSSGSAAIGAIYWAGNFSKSSYLRWLRELLGAPTLGRDDLGSHPYARVHLLAYGNAQGQPWSHLIFAGFYDGAWPALHHGVCFILAS